MAWPDSDVSTQALLPTGCRPCTLLKLASTRVPMVCVSPLVYLATRLPSLPTDRPMNSPLE
ncbi:Uncharacterised protein [Bordetella pertussis]|nr:Uncharacterised protein [Bordetella pertussis]